MRETLAALASALGRLGVRWCLLGAQAAVVYGRVRMTADIDITVDLGSCTVTMLLDALVDSGFVGKFALDETFLAGSRVLPVVHRASGMPVDIMLAGPGIEELILDAAVLTVIADVEVPMIRAEHLVVTKILAGRTHDLEDVVGILAARGDRLDLREIEKFLELLEGALDQSDLLPRWHSIVGQASRPRRSR